ncbi:MAG: PEP-CTERM sorting domain-containing protein [Betaproteobacteria bacterium]
MIKNILTAAVIGLAAIGAQANELSNGSFESSSSSSGSYCYGAACSVADWTAPLLISSTSGPWSDPSATAGTIDLGNWVAGIQNNQVLSSDFSLIAGHTYTLTWDDAGRAYYDTHSYDITSGGQEIASLTTVAGQAWSEHTLTFTAGASGELTFAGVNTRDGTTFIDNVSITTTAIPEPASLLLMLAGLAPLVAWRRRSRA